jgi:hypothetical protein
MNASITEIRNIELLTDIFGQFPTFHDSEVLRVIIDRGNELGPSLEAIVHVFEMTSEIDENGKFALKNHVLVNFCFSKITNLEINEFNRQNVLQGLHIEPCSLGLRVNFEGIFGMSAAFECEGASIVSVEPYIF